MKIYAMLAAIVCLSASAAIAADPIKDRQGRIVGWVNSCQSGNCLQFKDAQGRPTYRAAYSGRSVVIYDRQGRRK